MTRSIVGFIILSLCVLVAGPLSGQGVVPVGAELVVTASDDLAGSTSAAADAAGNFFVVWASYDSEIQGRLFDAGGAPQGPAFQVNSYTTGGQGGPHVAAKGDGEFVVVWISVIGEPPDIEITLEGQRFEADGTAAGSQFQAAPHSPTLSRLSSAPTGGGEFVVVWSTYSFSVNGYTIRGRRMSSEGLPLGAEFQVNTHPTNRQYDPLVKSDADGDFVVVWESYGSFGNDHSESSIQARRFASSGAPLGNQFQVNTEIIAFQQTPALAVAEDGTFVIAWRTYVSYTIEGQRFAADGSFLGDQFQIDDPMISGEGRDPEAASGPGDSFLVTWRSPLGSESDIQARYFPAGGGPGEPQFQVNSYTTGAQNGLAVATDRNGEFLVVWRHPTIRGQFLEVTLFADGFESGDTTAWSSAER